MREIYFNVSEAGCQESPVLIGYQGENEVTRVNVDYSEWVAEFGPGSLTLEVMRSGDTAPYLALLTNDGDGAYWLVSNVDTGARGIGAAGFVYKVGDQIKRSAVFRFFVGPDVGGTPGERPDPYESLIAYIESLLARTEESAAAAAESAQNAADEADKAETARRAVEDLGVTAHEDPNGPSVEKTVDPETGAVTLDFGLKSGGVSAVNGQTGAVSLGLDDIPDGAQYARTTPAQVQQISANENEIGQLQTGKQAKITASGILKGDGAGGVSAAVAGTDYITGLEVLSYGNSTWNDFLDAYTANKVVYCRASSNTNPASGSQTRMAFMAYVNDAANPTNVEFQYYRSVQTHSDSQQGDQVFVYKLDKTAGWSVTTRNTFSAIDAGTGLSKAYANGKLTLSVDGYRTAADQDVIDAAQDERLDAVEQTTTATTIGPVALATFNASAADMPLKGLTVDIEPVQAAGTPSPENPLPITGWTGCNIVQSPTLNAQDGNTYTIQLGDTVYGGTLDVTNGTLTVTHKNYYADGSVPWETQNGVFVKTLAYVKRKNTVDRNAHIVFSEIFKPGGVGYRGDCGDGEIIKVVGENGQIACYSSTFASVADFNAYLTEHPMTIVYELENPVTYQLTPTQIDTLLGENNIWANTGDVTVTYGAYLETVKKYAEVVGDSILSAIAPLETSYTASRAYTVGSYLFVGTKFYKVTAAIAEGGTITPGTNVIQTTVAEQLSTLAVKPAILG